MGHEMRFRSLLTSVLVLITCIAASGCSSLGVALDTSLASEEYFTEGSTNKEDSSENSLQVLPRLVKGKKFGPLIEFSGLRGLLGNEKATYGFGFDYDILYYGYDTPSLVSDVLNNKKSLADAIEYPSEESGKSGLNLFIFSPTLLLVLNLNEDTFLGLGGGLALYTSVSFNRENYEIKEEEPNINSILLGVNLLEEFNLPISVIFKYSSVRLRVRKPGSFQDERLNYKNQTVTFRYYF